MNINYHMQGIDVEHGWKTGQSSDLVCTVLTLSRRRYSRVSTSIGDATARNGRQFAWPANFLFSARTVVSSTTDSVLAREFGHALGVS